MGIVMIRCPETQQGISTGIQVDRATFHSCVYRKLDSAIPVVKAAENGL